MSAAPEKFASAARDVDETLAGSPPTYDEAIVLARAVEGGALDHAIEVGLPGHTLLAETLALAESILGKPVPVGWFCHRTLASAFWTAYYARLKTPFRRLGTNSSGPR